MDLKMSPTVIVTLIPRILRTTSLFALKAFIYAVTAHTTKNTPIIINIFCHHALIVVKSFSPKSVMANRVSIDAIIPKATVKLSRQRILLYNFLNFMRILFHIINIAKDMPAYMWWTYFLFMPHFVISMPSWQ